MERWRPQQFQRGAESRGTPSGVVSNALQIAEQTLAVDADLPPIFTLRHLAHLTQADYGFLRGIVTRDIDDPYTVFRIRKRTAAPRQEFRIICVPNARLMDLQRWIAQRVLSRGRTHSASYAYSPGSRALAAAQVHCGSRWLIKIDVRRFFESISEISAWRVFRDLGYQPLVAFELARICTRSGGSKTRGSASRWRRELREHAIPKYQNVAIGHLPQGAPTSPMLANLAMRGFDSEVMRIAEKRGLLYTRYADDLHLSTRSHQFTRLSASEVIQEVYKALARAGLSPNIAKTRVVPPGGRKIVLGTTVNDWRPHLSREFKARLRLHLYYLNHSEIGPVRHAEKRGFVSVAGLRDHITGLVAFASEVETGFGAFCRNELQRVRWPY